MDQLEITFSDLNEDAQRVVLEFFGIDTPEKGNIDLIPLFILEKE
jgi:hypothetical protein